MIDSQDPRQLFSPDELADLRIIRGRARIDRGDIQPMRCITFQDGTKVERVLFWLDALNLEVD